MSRAGDYSIVKDANRGSELERVLLTHGPALGRLAASYESRPALREELLQDIAFALWRALPSFRHEASEKTFVMRIATNRALSHIAARPPAADGLDAASEIADSLPRPDELAARIQTASRLQQAVRELVVRQVQARELVGRPVGSARWRLAVVREGDEVVAPGDEFSLCVDAARE